MFPFCAVCASRLAVRRLEVGFGGLLLIWWVLKQAKEVAFLGMRRPTVLSYFRGFGWMLGTEELK